MVPRTALHKTTRSAVQITLYNKCVRGVDYSSSSYILHASHINTFLITSSFAAAAAEAAADARVTRLCTSPLGGEEGMDAA